jgi:TonB family protein
MTTGKNCVLCIAAAMGLTAAAMADPVTDSATTVIQHTPPANTAPVSLGKPACFQDYPAAAKATHATGTAVIAYTVTAAGAVDAVHVEQSSGNPVLDQSAVACAAQWQYRPATQNGTPVAAPWKLQVHWSIDPFGGTSILVADIRSNIVPPIPTGAPHYCSQEVPIAEKPNLTGSTRVGFVITAKGTVENVMVKQSSGSKFLDDSAITCASSWLYRPAVRDGVPFPVPWQADVNWQER